MSTNNSSSTNEPSSQKEMATSPLEATNTALEQAPSTAIGGGGSDESLFPGQLMEIPKCYPKCRGQPVFRGNPEALAWALDSSSTIVTFIGSGAFLGTALLKLAKDAAGCEVEPLESGEDVPDCNEKIYGIRPSSLISTVMTIVNVVSASTMPFLGAVVDTTPYRRFLGRISAAIFCSVIFTGIFVSEETWFAIAILQIVMGFTAWFQTMVVYSYLPELTRDEVVLNEYTRAFATLAYMSMVLYLAVVTGTAGALGYMTENDENKSSLDDEIATARIAQSVSFTVCCIGETLSWGFLFQKRPALRKYYEAGQSVWTQGFRQVGKTYVKIYKYYPRLKWFYLAICFCDSALMAFTLLSITYLTEQLDMDAAQNGMTILFMLITAIPGSYISGYANRRIGPVLSSMAALVLLIIMIALIAILLKGPGQEIEAYILAGGYGLGMGWKWTCDRMVLVLCLPNTEQNAELSGVYVFSRQILSWLPPLVFTVLNEKGVSLRIGIATLDIYLLAGLFAYWRLLVSGPEVDTSDAATDDSPEQAENVQAESLLVSGPEVDTSDAATDDSPEQAENEVHASEPEKDALVQAESLDETDQSPTDNMCRTPLHDIPLQRDGIHAIR